jgi:hypothetical protein
MFRLEKMMLNRFSKFKVQVQFSKRIAGYSNTQGARGAGGWGWGFNTPSQSLVNAYEPGDVRKNATIILREQLCMMVE